MRGSNLLTPLANLANREGGSVLAIFVGHPVAIFVGHLVAIFYCAIWHLLKIA